MLLCLVALGCGLSLELCLLPSLSTFLSVFLPHPVDTAQGRKDSASITQPMLKALKGHFHFPLVPRLLQGCSGAPGCADLSRMALYPCAVAHSACWNEVPADPVRCFLSSGPKLSSWQPWQSCGSEGLALDESGMDFDSLRLGAPALGSPL